MVSYTYLAPGIGKVYCIGSLYWTDTQSWIVQLNALATQQVLENKKNKTNENMKIYAMDQWTGIAESKHKRSMKAKIDLIQKFPKRFGIKVRKSMKASSIKI